MSAPDTDKDSTCQGFLYVGASYLLRCLFETLYLYCSFMLGTCRAAVKPLLGPTMNCTQRMWLRKWTPCGNRQKFKNKHIGNNLLVNWNNLDSLIHRTQRTDMMLMVLFFKKSSLFVKVINRPQKLQMVNASCKCEWHKPPSAYRISSFWFFLVVCFQAQTVTSAEYIPLSCKFCFRTERETSSSIQMYGGSASSLCHYSFHYKSASNHSTETFIQWWQCRLKTKVDRK